MIRVFIADAKPEERSAIRRLIFDQMLDMAGEASDWATTIIQVPHCHVNILMVDWELLPNAQNEAIAKLRMACPEVLIVVLLSHLDVREQAALSAGADAFISKSEMPEQVAEHLSAVAARIRVL